MEDTIREKRKKLSNEQIQEEFEEWFQNLRFSRTRVTEMYLMTKALIAQVIR
jgi:hypothetical protein